MRVCLDIEANALENPTEIWCVVCKDIGTGDIHIFRNITSDDVERERFILFWKTVDLFIGHNVLDYDIPNVCSLIGVDFPDTDAVVDTLIISKMVDYSREGHSVEDYGLEFGLEKIDFTDFTKYSKELEEYCIRDVLITHKIYLKYLKYIQKTEHLHSIRLEHKFQKICNQLHNNGFYFNITKATTLLTKVTKELEELDKEILKEFPPRSKLIREFTPKLTKFGTINLTSVPKHLRDNIHEYEAGKTYPVFREEAFNPSSHKQIVDILHEAGWSPTDRTVTYVKLERDYNKLKYSKNRDIEFDKKREELYNKLIQSERYSWKINENNLDTLPPSAPSPARTLAKRILLESRRRTLTEWLGLVHPDNRIRGRFYGIGAWTHRMAHQKPNTANIPNEFAIDGSKKLLGKELRSLWCAPRNRLLVGVDAEGIQLRIFAHYIDDPEFTDALVKGKKDDKTDPHSLNQRILGSVCKSRAAAKRFIYALLLGAGLGKLAEILGASNRETEEALNRLLERYSGFAHLKQKVIPADARRGYFIGLDGRPVRIPGDTESYKRHLAMSGYLQNGEAVIMKKACIKWYEMLEDIKDLWKIVNFVHDEWQTECVNDFQVALRIAKTQADSLRIVGEELGLKCPLAGSYWNDDHKDYTIGLNWSVTH